MFTPSFCLSVTVAFHLCRVMASPTFHLMGPIWSLRCAYIPPQREAFSYYTKKKERERERERESERERERERAREGGREGGGRGEGGREGGEGGTERRRDRETERRRDGAGGEEGQDEREAPWRHLELRW